MKRLALCLCAALLLCLCACTSPVSPTPAPTESPALTAPPTATPVPATPAPGPTPTPAPEPTPTATAAPEADRSLSAGGVEYPAYLFSGDLRGDGKDDFTCVLPVEGVTAAYEHNAWVFRSVADPAAWLELSFIAGGDVESLLPGFMDGYLDFTAVEFSEAAALGRVRGDVGRVSAENEALQADAWLLDVSGGTVSAVLCRPAASAEEALLRAVLDTFALIG